MRRALWSALLAAATALPACVSDVDDDEGSVALEEVPFARRGAIPARRGFIDGRRLAYYDFGEIVPADLDWFPSFDEFPGMPAGELYVFADSAGELTLAQQQYPIIDRLPQQARYSDFLEIIAVTPPAGYAANDVKSRATLLRLGYGLERTGQLVNCPVVGPEAELEAAPLPARAAFRRITVWYRKQRAHCLLLDGGAALLPEGAPAGRSFATPLTDERIEHRAAAAEVYLLRSNAFSLEDRVSNITVPHNAIFRAAPDAAEYSPLVKIWDVGVPSDYQSGQLTSYAQLFPIPDFTDPRIEERSPDALCNCPIVAVEEPAQ